jgi:hypothetical protein
MNVIKGTLLREKQLPYSKTKKEQAPARDIILFKILLLFR